MEGNFCNEKQNLQIDHLSTELTHVYLTQNEIIQFKKKKESRHLRDAQKLGVL